MDWKPLALTVAAYLMGSFPTGVVLSLRRFGIDVRDMGSGNIGATNITRNFGWKAGVITFLIDFMKGYLAIRLAQVLCIEDPRVVTYVGTAVVLGHCFSAFLKFRGGKGVATTMGCLFAAAPVAGGIMAATYLVLLAVTRISAAGSLAGVLLVCLYAWFVSMEPSVRDMIFLCALIVLVRHQSNLRRFVGKPA